MHSHLSHSARARANTRAERMEKQQRAEEEGEEEERRRASLPLLPPAPQAHSALAAAAVASPSPLPSAPLSPPPPSSARVDSRRWQRSRPSPPGVASTPVSSRSSPVAARSSRLSSQPLSPTPPPPPPSALPTGVYSHRGSDPSSSPRTSRSAATSRRQSYSRLVESSEQLAALEQALANLGSPPNSSRSRTVSGQSKTWNRQKSPASGISPRLQPYASSPATVLSPLSSYRCPPLSPSPLSPLPPVASALSANAWTESRGSSKGPTSLPSPSPVPSPPAATARSTARERASTATSPTSAASAAAADTPSSSSSLLSPMFRAQRVRRHRRHSSLPEVVLAGENGLNSPRAAEAVAAVPKSDRASFPSSPISPVPSLHIHLSPCTPHQANKQEMEWGAVSASSAIPSAISPAPSPTPSPPPPPTFTSSILSVSSPTATTASPPSSARTPLTSPLTLASPFSPAFGFSPTAGSPTPSPTAARLSQTTPSPSLSPSPSPSSSISSASAGLTSVGPSFCPTAPSSFLPVPSLSPLSFYLSRCQVWDVPPNSSLQRLFESDLAGVMHASSSAAVWDCGCIYLGHRGVGPLLDVFEAYGHKVEELSLRATGMRNAQVQRLVQIIRQNMPSKETGSTSPLRSLDLSDNPLSSDAGKQLLLLVNLSPRLTHMSLNGTHIDSATLRSIQSSCAANLRAMGGTSQNLSLTGRTFGSRWKEAGGEGKKDPFAPSSEGLTPSPSPPASHVETQADRDRATVKYLLRVLPVESDVVSLLSRYSPLEAHVGVWQDVRLVRRFVKRLVECGQHRRAFELAERFVRPTKKNEGSANTSLLPNFEGDETLQWWRVHALARSRNFTDAFKEIRSLLAAANTAQGGVPPTIQANLLGLAAMLRKSLYETSMRADMEQAKSAGRREELSAWQEEDASESAALYLRSYEAAHGLMEGVAAATMLRLANKSEASSRLAKKVLQEATSELAMLQQRTPSSASAATSSTNHARELAAYSALGEAHLHLQRPNAAYRFYQQAVEMAGGNLNHLSMLQQNLTLLSHKQVRIGDVMNLFNEGNVCIFAGLAIDHPTQDCYAFPPSRDLELEVSYQIDLALERHEVQVGFTSLSCGSEILFAEKLLEKKGEVHIVLPFHLEDVMDRCVEYPGVSTMSRWRTRALAVLARCEVHWATQERFLSDSSLFPFHACIMEGLALIRARELGVATPIAMAVLDSGTNFSSCRPNTLLREWRAKYKRETTGSATSGAGGSGSGNNVCTVAIDLVDCRRKVLQAPGPGGGGGGGVSGSGGGGGGASGGSGPHAASGRHHVVRRYAEAQHLREAEQTPASHATRVAPPDLFTAQPPVAGSPEYAALLAPPTASSSSTSSSSSPTHSSGTPSPRVVTALQFASRFSRTVKFMLFADVAPLHGQLLTEALTPTFFRVLFKLLERTRSESRVAPFYANTWSTGLYFIFNTVTECAEFSLQLLQVVEKMDWASVGLPPSAACLGMHGGPLFPGYNPVEEKDLFFGAHVCRAARIKAITPAGAAYASEHFVAALAVADWSQHRFWFEYLGHRDLAKSYDRCPLYRLCRIEDVRKQAVIKVEEVVGGGKELDKEAQATASATQTATTPSPSAPLSIQLGSNLPSASASSATSTADSDSVSALSGTPFNHDETSVTPPTPLTPAALIRAPPPLLAKWVENYLSSSLSATPQTPASPTPSSPSSSSSSPSPWSNVQLLHALVHRTLLLGQHPVAFRVLHQALGYDSPHRDDLQLQYYRVLALRHSESKAEELLRELKQTVSKHPNQASIPTELRASILSLSGRMLKDKCYELIRADGDPALIRSLAHESSREYFFAYELCPASFPAIHAATMLLLSQQPQRAKALAKVAVRLVADELLERHQRQRRTLQGGGGDGVEKDEELWPQTATLTVKEERADMCTPISPPPVHPPPRSRRNSLLPLSRPPSSTPTPPKVKPLQKKKVLSRRTSIVGLEQLMEDKLDIEGKERAVKGEADGEETEQVGAAGQAVKEGGEEYWMYASMAEGHLILGDPAKSLLWYRRALQKAQGHMGSIASIYRNFMLLQSCVRRETEEKEEEKNKKADDASSAEEKDAEPGPTSAVVDPLHQEIQQIFVSSLGRVIVCASQPLLPYKGKQQDETTSTALSPASSASSSSSSPSSPSLLSLSAPDRYYHLVCQLVVSELGRQLDFLRPTVSFVLLCSDTDLLMAECMLERGVELHVILVHSKSVFLKRCEAGEEGAVGIRRLQGWKRRLQSIFKASILHFITRDKQPAQGVGSVGAMATTLLYQFNRTVLQGLTMLRAQQLDCGQPMALCVLEASEASESPPASSPSLSPLSSSTFDPAPAPLPQSSAGPGTEFPASWCSLHPAHECVIVNLHLVRKVAGKENAEWEKRKKEEKERERKEAIKKAEERLATTDNKVPQTDAANQIASSRPPSEEKTQATPSLSSSPDRPVHANADCSTESPVGAQPYSSFFDTPPSQTSGRPAADASTPSSPSFGAQSLHSLLVAAESEQTFDGLNSSPRRLSTPLLPLHRQQQNSTLQTLAQPKPQVYSLPSSVQHSRAPSLARDPHASNSELLSLSSSYAPTAFSSLPPRPSPSPPLVQILPGVRPDRESAPRAVTAAPIGRRPSIGELASRSRYASPHLSPAMQPLPSTSPGPLGQFQLDGGPTSGEQSDESAMVAAILRAVDATASHSSPHRSSPSSASKASPRMRPMPPTTPQVSTRKLKQRGGAKEKREVRASPGQSLPASSPSNTPLQSATSSACPSPSPLHLPTPLPSTASPPTAPPPQFVSPLAPSGEGGQSSSASYYQQRSEAAATNLSLLMLDILQSKKKEDTDTEGVAAAKTNEPDASPLSAACAAEMSDCVEMSPLALLSERRPSVQPGKLPGRRHGHTRSNSTPLTPSQLRHILPPPAAALQVKEETKQEEPVSVPEQEQAPVSESDPSSPPRVLTMPNRPSPRCRSSTGGGGRSPVRRTSGSGTGTATSSRGKSRAGTPSTPKIGAKRPSVSKKSSRAGTRSAATAGGTTSAAHPSLSLPFRPQPSSRGSVSSRAPVYRHGARNGSSFIGPTLTEAAYTRTISFIIFADVRNYSKLSQEQTPLFCTHFLNIVRQVIDLFLQTPAGEEQQQQPASSTTSSSSTGATTQTFNSPTSSLQFFNTWGDGLFLVFTSAVECSRFALVLLHKVHHTTWSHYGLPSDLTLRVGMHAGPVLVGWDPVVRRMNYFGPHIEYAQLIEPITTPGCAFASAPFAACLATASDPDEFHIEYVGAHTIDKAFAEEDYEGMDKKEQMDYKKCNLYRITENKQRKYKKKEEKAREKQAAI